jgi:hypothetical protein
MSKSRLDYSRSKALAKARRYGERDTSNQVPYRQAARGWRTEYPTEFPVTVTYVTNPQQSKGLAA